MSQRVPCVRACVVCLAQAESRECSRAHPFLRQIPHGGDSIVSAPDPFEWCPNGTLNLEGTACSCSKCSPKSAPIVVDFSTWSHVDLCCPVDGCGCERLELMVDRMRRGLTMYWECEECKWEINTTFRFVKRKGSPEPVTRRCRLCDSEVTVRIDRRSWACFCGLTTKASDPPFTSTGSEHSDGVWCKNTLLTNRQWRKQHWSRIPNARQQEILDHVNVSEDYINHLEATLQYIRTYALSY